MNTVCKFCYRDCINRGGLVAHEPYCKQNPKRINRSLLGRWTPESQEKQRQRMLGDGCWNRGLTKETDPRVAKQAEAVKGIVPWNKGKTKETDPRVAKQAEAVKKSNWAQDGGNGGHKRGSGRSIKSKYKGIHTQSSYERVFVEYNLDLGVDVKRATEKFSYIHEGKELQYHPDFIVDGKYVEIKGYEDARWKSKVKYFPYDLMVLKQEDLQKEIQYAMDKYKCNSWNQFLRHLKNERMD
jgi:hypothetical protein|tara:strand:+ start:1043 stop:1762 length:720 start_codon:yes stop_codon:yes gene_type:complete